MDYLNKILVSGIVLLLALLFARADSSRIADIGLSSTLKYGWRFRTFVLLFFGWIPVFSIMVYLKGDLSDAGEQVSVVFLNLLALYAFLEVYFVSITFDENGVTARSPWRMTRWIQWSEIKRYDFSGWSQWHLLHTEAKGTVRLSVYLTGLVTFFEELDQKAPGIEIIQASS